MMYEETPNQRRAREAAEKRLKFIKDMGGTVGHSHAAQMFYRREKQHNSHK